MAIATPKYKISFIDDTDVEVQTIPWDYMQAEEKFPSVNWSDEDTITMRAIFWIAWHAAVRQKLITDTKHRQKFDEWAPLVGAVEALDDDEQDPTDSDPADTAT